MLKTAAKFHKYSFNNQLLIMVQKPDATHVAGFNRWKSLNRLVRKGEKGIAILAPVIYKKDKVEVGTSDLAVEVAAAPNGEDRPKTDRLLRAFKVVHVFDISQTEGEDLELDAVKPELLDGEVPEGLWDSLVALATEAGYTVVRKERGSANGYCDFLAKEIGVEPTLPELQAVKTLIHELAHALLHGGDVQPSRDVAEIEVESVAFIVLDVLNLSSDSYSFPYVARWSSGYIELVKASAERTVNCASQILQGCESASNSLWNRRLHRAKVSLP
jgi:hypothetical protein